MFNKYSILLILPQRPNEYRFYHKPEEVIMDLEQIRKLGIRHKILDPQNHEIDFFTLYNLVKYK